MRLSLYIHIHKYVICVFFLKYLQKKLFSFKLIFGSTSGPNFCISFSSSFLAYINNNIFKNQFTTIIRYNNNISILYK